MAGRIGLIDITPTVAGGRYPAKAVVGRPIEVGATVFREGHDAVAANVVFRPVPAKGSKPRPQGPLNRMAAGIPGTDRWSATVIPDSQGRWTLTVEAWGDPLETWRHAVEVKAAVGQTADELANDLESGARLLERIARRPRNPLAATIRGAVATLRDTTLTVTDRIAAALEPATWAALQADPIRELLTKSAPYEVWVDRELAEFGSWYEFFPRSIGSEIDWAGKPVRHGTFRDAITELPRVAAMGFDVVYLPPIHPIGEVNRKGRNNTVDPEVGDVGSPWAIGSALGGHDAVHPELGTIDDFDNFVAAATAHNLAVALDFALQCAPDHPWVSSHPEWFTTRPDGSIA
ncbi:MAG: maltotransferase domain-containing protein, partial [Nakamurella sp.]